ncbi:MAG: cupin domain-containing protein [Dongiaceae bacterium]
MRLIAPVDAGTFVRDHWEQRPLRIARGDPAFHDGLLSLADLDGLLSHASIRAPDIRILRDGKETPVRELTGEAQNAHVGRLEAVYAAYRDGATISMQALNERHPPLAALCRSLALELSARFQVNAYLTPADARGLSIHYDTHDVFVLQVEGSKRWHLYDSPVRLPTRRQPFRRGDADLGAPVESFVLERGDTLYLPRGVVHSAESGSATSLHLTVGAYPVTWAGLLRGALEAAIEEDAALRQSLPPGFALRPAERAAAERRLGELIRGLAARWDAPTLIGDAAETALAPPRRASRGISSTSRRRRR